MKCKNHREALKNIIIEAQKNRKLKLWLWEIDHWTGHLLTKSNEGNNEDDSGKGHKIANGVHEIVQIQLKKELERYIEEKRIDFDSLVTDIRSKKELIKCIEEFIRDESQANLNIDEFMQFFNM